MVVQGCAAMQADGYLPQFRSSDAEQQERARDRTRARSLTGVEPAHHRHDGLRYVLREGRRTSVVNSRNVMNQ